MSNLLPPRVERDGNALIFKRVDVAGRGFYDIRIEIKDGQTPTEAFEANILRIRQLASQVFQQQDPASSKITYKVAPETCSHPENTVEIREIWQNLFGYPAAQAGTRIAIPETPQIPLIPQPAAVTLPVAPVSPANAEPLTSPSASSFSPTTPPEAAVTPSSLPGGQRISSKEDLLAAEPASSESSGREEEISSVKTPSVKPFEFDTSKITGDEKTDKEQFFDEVAKNFSIQRPDFHAKFPGCNYTSLKQALERTPSVPSSQAYLRLLKNPKETDDLERDLMRDLIEAFYKAAYAKRRKALGTNQERKPEDIAAEIVNFLSVKGNSEPLIKYLASLS